MNSLQINDLSQFVNLLQLLQTAQAAHASNNSDTNNQRDGSGSDQESRSESLIKTESDCNNFRVSGLGLEMGSNDRSLLDEYTALIGNDNKLDTHLSLLSQLNAPQTPFSPTQKHKHKLCTNSHEHANCNVNTNSNLNTSFVSSSTCTPSTSSSCSLSFASFPSLPLLPNLAHCNNNINGNLANHSPASSNTLLSVSTPSSNLLPTACTISRSGSADTKKDPLLLLHQLNETMPVNAKSNINGRPFRLPLFPSMPSAHIKQEPQKERAGKLETETLAESESESESKIKNELNVQQKTNSNPDASEDLEIIQILAGMKDKILNKHKPAIPIKTETEPPRDYHARIDQLDTISRHPHHQLLALAMDQDTDYSIDDDDDEQPFTPKFKEEMSETTDNRLPPSIAMDRDYTMKMKIEPPSKPPPPARPPLDAMVKLKFEGDYEGIEAATNMADRSKKAYTCEYDGCHYATSNQAHLRKHLRIHTNERPFECHLCHKSFKQKSNLKTHVRIHTGQRPFECSTCHKRFTQRSSLVQHQKIHSGEKPFVCGYAGCNKRFKRKDHLKSHHRVHTGEKPEKCSFAGCNKSFATPQQLKLHYMDHTGVRPFNCSYPGCGKRFKTNSLLTRHKVTHSAIKPFICSLCNKGFSRKIHFNKHKCLNAKAKSNQLPPRV